MNLNAECKMKIVMTDWATTMSQGEEPRFTSRMKMLYPMVRKIGCCKSKLALRYAAESGKTTG